MQHMKPLKNSVYKLILIILLFAALIIAVIVYYNRRIKAIDNKLKETSAMGEIRLTKFSNGEALNEAFKKQLNTELNFVSLPPMTNDQ
jgi:hypothetical protein